MSRSLKILVITILLAGTAGYVLFRNVNIISCCMGDIDQKGMKDILLLTGTRDGEYGEYVYVISFSLFKPVKRLDFGDLNPWKVQLPDVDGDGKCELSLGVYKATRFYPLPEKRPFLYNLYDGGVSPKWLGSRLSRPFKDYIFGDIQGDEGEELISIEYLSNGDMVVNTYQWKGFGFEGLAESQPFRDISRIKIDAGGKNEECRIKVRVRMEQKWEWIVLKYKGNKLVSEKKGDV